MGSSKERPLMMLKDYLREEQSFDARGGFTSTHRGCYEATVRRLLDMELREGVGGRGKPTGLTRGRSKGVALTRISSLLNAVRMLATGSASSRNPKQGILQRSLSKKLLPKTFWRRRCSQSEDLRGHLRSPVGSSGGIGEGRFLIKDVIRLESFVDEARGDKAVFSNSSLGSSRFSCSTSGWSEIDSSSGSDSVGSSSSPVPEFAKPDSPLPPEKKRSDTVAGSPSRSTGDSKIEEIKERESGDGATCHDYEEKEQLSPVSVLDFPYDEEETASEAASASASASASFHQSLATIERTKHELLKKIRRFESLAHLVDPVDLDEPFSEEETPEDGATDGQDDESADDVWARARWLLEQAKGWNATERGSNEILLLDFFVEGLREEDRTAEEWLLLAAREWTDGITRKDVASHEALMKEIDMDGRWRCANVVDEVIAAELEGEVLATLLDKLVLEMFLD